MEQASDAEQYEDAFKCRRGARTMTVNQNAAWRIRRNSRRVTLTEDPQRAGQYNYTRVPVDQVLINQLATGYQSNNSPPTDPTET
jgi:hypothetical protein